MIRNLEADMSIQQNANLTKSPSDSDPRGKTQKWLRQEGGEPASRESSGDKWQRTRQDLHQHENTLKENSQSGDFLHGVVTWRRCGVTGCWRTPREPALLARRGGCSDTWSWVCKSEDKTGRKTCPTWTVDCCCCETRMYTTDRPPVAPLWCNSLKKQKSDFISWTVYRTYGILQSSYGHLANPSSTCLILSHHYRQTTITCKTKSPSPLFATQNDCTVYVKRFADDRFKLV